jgi:hypothetical protein
MGNRLKLLIVVKGFIFYSLNCHAQNLQPFYANYKVGYTDSAGQTIVQPIYDAGSVMQNGYAIVVQNNKRGLINNAGKLILPLEFEDILMPNNNVIVAKQNGLYGMMDANQKWMIAPIFTKAFSCKNGMIRVERQQKVGFVNITDLQLPTKMYADAADYANGLAAVCINNKWGYINTKGKLILGCNYDYAFAFSQEGTALVGMHNQDYLINKQGKVLRKIENEQEPEEEYQIKPKHATND